MKFVIIISFLLSGFSIPVLHAQEQPLSGLMDAYYGITNALIKDDGAAAQVQAQQFHRVAESVDISKMSKAQQKVWLAQKSSLMSGSESISKTTAINQQRAQLNDLSISLFTVLKAFPGEDSPIYYQYCPMKKAYWLSNEKAIKNPYYGKQMLSCGNTKEVLK
jgi:hypothetical protein